MDSIRPWNVVEIFLALTGPVRPAEPLQVSARVVTTGKLYVGQGVEIRVEVRGLGGTAEVAPPALAEADAEVHRLSNTRFVVVPRRSKALVIPPFRATSA